jgi:hypothetical protein
MTVMTIQAVVFDIGGVLEVTLDLGVTGMWESRLGLAPGELNKRMHDAWRGGSIGTISEDEVHQALAERLGLDEQRLADFMGDIWREYLGTANTELIDYGRRLRPRYRTGIVSIASWVPGNENRPLTDSRISSMRSSTPTSAG